MKKELFVVVVVVPLAVFAVLFFLTHRPTRSPAPPSLSSVHTSTQVEFPAPQPIEERLRNQDAQDAWLRRRDLEFDKCAALHGTPTLGFGMRVVCLDSHAVKFVGEEHPPYENSLK